MSEKYIYTIFLYCTNIEFNILGYKHSVYNQDYHHNFLYYLQLLILIMVLSYLKKYSYNTVQDKFFFFKLIDNFVNINLFSISFITSIIYS